MDRKELLEQFPIGTFVRHENGKQYLVAGTWQLRNMPALLRLETADGESLAASPRCVQSLTPLGVRLVQA